jgi:hypothetical protein
VRRPHAALLAAGKALLATLAVAAAWLVVSAYGSPVLVASLLSMFAFCR